MFSSLTLTSNPLFKLPNDKSYKTYSLLFSQVERQPVMMRKKNYRYPEMMKNIARSCNRKRKLNQRRKRPPKVLQLHGEKIPCRLLSPWPTAESLQSLSSWQWPNFGTSYSSCNKVSQLKLPKAI